MGRISLLPVAGALIAIFALLLVGAAGKQGIHIRNLMLFLDLLTLICVFGCAFGLMVFTHGAKTFGFLLACMKAIFFKQNAPSPENAEMAKDAAFYCLAGGFVGCVDGIIKMLAFLTDPSRIGCGIAVALLSLLYAAFASGIVFIPLSRKFALGSGSAPQRPLAALVLPALGLLLIIGAMGITLAVSGAKDANGVKRNPDVNISISMRNGGQTELIINNFSANLKPEKGGGLPLIRLDIAMTLHGKGVQPMLDGSMAIIRSTLVAACMSLSAEEAPSNEGRVKLEKLMQEKLKEALPKDVSLDSICFPLYLTSTRP